MEFPESVTFRLQASSARPLQSAELEFGTNLVYSCSSQSYSRVRLGFEPDSDVDLSWEWQMKKTGSIPPGATIWWRWRLVDQERRVFVSPTEELAWEDTRFEWSSFTQDNLTIHWYEGGSTYGEELAEIASQRLDTVPVGAELAKPITAFVYARPQHVRDAILFAQEWAGGIAFPSHNILLIAVPSSDVDTYERGLVHELTHLLVQEVSFNCFSDLPTWLDEGLASYAEGAPPPFQSEELARAIRFDQLISARSLNSVFPADPDSAILSYAQSSSLVTYLVASYGWEKMRELLAEFEQGSTTDDALRQVYGFDIRELDNLWRGYIGVE